MGYHERESGNGAWPPGWQPVPPQQPAPSKGGLLDLAKGGVPITLICGAIVVLAQVFMSVGQYQERGANMARQLDELKADVKVIKEALPDLKAALKRLEERPQWSVSVKEARR